MKTSLFGIYHTLADSGLFDPHYYRAANPEIAASGLDPLVHYIEQGARLGLSPHPAFDVAYYLEQCAARGERPENPLLHYITVGAASGLRHGRPAQAAEAGNGASEPQRRLFIDAPQLRDGAVATPIRGSLTITGWALARAGIAAIDVAVDGMRLLSARHGTPRPDVQAAYPEWEGSLRSGFAATIPHRSLPLGTHAVAVVLRDKAGGQERAEFRIEVEGRADAPAIGALRRKMAQAEIALDCHSLALLGWHPTFLVVVLAAGGAAAIGRLRQTLRTLRVQAYADWRAVLVPRGGGRLARDRVLAGFEDIAARVSVAPPSPGTPLGRLARGGARRRPAFAVMLRAGDELGCDALMEFALATGLDRAADLLYGDDWRADAHGRRAPFLKPGWSPDLLLSTDYVGAWCASAALLDRVALTPARLAKDGGYDAALRLGEAARAIRRVPAVLSQPGAAAEPRAVARRALEAALARRGIAGDVVPGRLAGTWRVRRTLAAPGTVSIIIPTRASRGLVKTCIETLRARTAYRDYEIVVLDHIPRSAEDAATWKSWLKGAADRVVPVAGPFNWSIFNNRAAAQSRGRHLLFLNDDIEIIEPDWLGALLEHGQRAEVGAAGPMLLYPDRTIQHAGMFLAAPGTARHAFRHLPEDDPGYFGLAQMQRDVLAVTGACLLTRRETFEQVGGFDERHTVINGDLDYCLRLWERGLFTVYTPYARLIHHEVASRGGLPEAYDARSFARRWQGLALDGDPFFHPRLSRAADDMVPEAEPVERVTATR
ncbi:MAG TPA: glycosyltransferase, partial [Stellaceae bacterium]|nr:glycosyltransferase [Stellaceae bacterium]